MALSQLLQQLSVTRRAVDENGIFLPEVQIIFEKLFRLFDENADTANTDISAAASTSVRGMATPSTVVFNSDSAGVFSAGDEDIRMEFKDKDGQVVATRTLNGLLNTGSGEVTVTNVSSTGLATSYLLMDNISPTVRADITVTLDDGSMVTESCVWNANDRSVSGTVPITGGGK